MYLKGPVTTERVRRVLSHLGQSAGEVKDKLGDLALTTRLRDGWSALLDLVYPPHLPASPSGANGRPELPGQTGLEAGHWAAVRFLEDRGCEMCARPFMGGLMMGEGARCVECSARPFAFERTRAACLYDEASRDLILMFKHGDRLDLVPMLTRWIERAAGPLIESAEVIVPVPLHRWRLWQRRYNQAAELARPIARRAGKPCLLDGLIRRKPTAMQGQGFEARARNVRGAFALTPEGTRAVEGRRVLLIDDVMTSGATANACAKVLLKAGAVSVDVACLARAGV